MEKLQKIQAELKAPKNQRNNFGKYNYRSCEDILEAVKPLLNKYNCTLTVSDEIKELGGILFVEAVSIISDGDPNQVHTQSFGSKAQAGRLTQTEKEWTLHNHLVVHLLMLVNTL